MATGRSGVRASVRALAWCGVLAPLVFTAGWVLAGLLQPGYSPLREDVSTLAAANAASPWMGVAVICLSGLLVVAAGAALVAASSGRPPLPAALIVLGGTLVVGAGILRIDCSPDTDAACRLRAQAGLLSWEHRAHAVVIAAALGAVLVAALVDGAGPGRGAGARWAALATVLGGVLLFAAFRAGVLPGWRGGLERAAATVPLLWVAGRCLPLTRARVDGYARPPVSAARPRGALGDGTERAGAPG